MGLLAVPFFPFYRENLTEGKSVKGRFRKKPMLDNQIIAHGRFQLFAKHGNRLLSFYFSQCWVQIIFYVISAMCRQLWKTNSRKIRESYRAKVSVFFWFAFTRFPVMNYRVLLNLISDLFILLLWLSTDYALIPFGYYNNFHDGNDPIIFVTIIFAARSTSLDLMESWLTMHHILYYFYLLIGLYCLTLYFRTYLNKNNNYVIK